MPDALTELERRFAAAVRADAVERDALHSAMVALLIQEADRELLLAENERLRSELEALREAVTRA